MNPPSNYAVNLTVRSVTRLAAFSRAQHFAQRGMVAIAAQYRLSDQKASHHTKRWRTHVQ
jgi:hypothetical protein